MRPTNPQSYCSRVCVSKQWRYKRNNGEVVILRDLFGKLVKWLQRFKEIGDTAVQYDPGHAALPWAGVRFLLEVAVADIERFNFMVEGAETIGYSIDRYAIIEDLYLRSGSTISTKLQDRLIVLYSQLLRYLIKAKQYFETRSGIRMLKAATSSKADFDGLSNSIASAQKDVDDYVALVDSERSRNLALAMERLALDQRSSFSRLEELLRDIDGPVRRIDHQLQSLEDHLESAERAAILQWISPEPYIAHHGQIKKDLLHGTGQWFMEEPLFRKWKRDSVSSMFWLHGTSGSGKTKLVSLVIEECLNQHHQGLGLPPVFFYCSRDSQEPRRSEPQAILASLARQLSNLVLGDLLLPPSTNLYKERKKNGSASGSLSVEESTKLIIDLMAYYPATTIVLDALDECKVDSRYILLDSLQEILRESTGLVKVFASSRDEGDLVCELSGYPSLKVSSDKNGGDIAVFVRTETQRLVERRRLLRYSDKKEEIQSLIIDRLIEGAGGIKSRFRWVSLQLDALCALKTDSDTLDRLGRLPQKLAALYSETYNDMLAHNYQAGQTLIWNTFRWLMCAQGELKSGKFLAAISQHVSKVPETLTRDKLLDLCCNFVIYDEDLDIFRFAHLFVQEFLETLPQFSIAVAHSLAAECCLVYIMKEAKSPTVQRFLADHYPFHDPEGIMSTHPFNLSGFEYAFSCGLRHCKKAGVERMQGSLQTLFHMFFMDDCGPSSPLYIWLNWLPDGTIDPKLREMLHRLRRAAVNKAESHLHCAFLIACAEGFPEIVSHCLGMPLPESIMAKGLLFATYSEHADVVPALKVRSPTAFTVDVFRYVLRELDTKAMEYDQLLPVFLDSDDIIPITKEVVCWACYSFDRMALLIFCHTRSGDETEKLLVGAASKLNSDILELLLRHTDKPRIEESMVELAANPRSLQTLLRHAQFVTPSIIKLALKNRHFDKSCLELLESRVGLIEATFDILEAAAACKSPWVWEEMLLRRGAQVTEDSIVLVASRSRYKAAQLLALHLANNTGVQISQELIERVIGLDSAVGVMEVLMEYLTPAFNVTEYIMHRAMSLSLSGEVNIVPLLLAQDPSFRITESLVECAMSSPLSKRLFLTPLLSHDRSFRISDHLVKQAVLPNSARVGDFTPDIVRSKEPIEETFCDTEEGLKTVKSLLDHEPAFRITFDLLEKLTRRHQLSEETMGALWDRLVKDGNAEEVVLEGLEHHRQGRNEHGSTAWALLLLRYDRGAVKKSEDPRLEKRT